jgi:hypothetical protein
MPRKQHTYHYIYKTTCKVTGKYYVGMHSTSNLDDSYIGSGKRLWYSILKHGRENHDREILEFLPDRSSLKEREKELVNESLLQDPMCMNLKIGGEGGNIGTDGIFFGGDSFKAASDWWKKADRSLTKEKTKHLRDRDVSEKICQTKLEKTGSRNGWKGRKHNPEYRKRMSEIMSDQQKGEKNSQYGKIWITNGKDNMMIKKDQEIPLGWRKGRKMVQ